MENYILKNKKAIIIIFSALFFIGIKQVSAASLVNNYILNNKIAPAKEQVNYRISMQDSSKNDGINMNFQDGKPKMVIIHDVGTEGSKIDNEITYMVNHQDSAFVHSFVDGSQLKTIANTNKKAWGSGPFGNRYADQIEQIRVNSKTEFAHQIASLANWTANQMIKYQMGAPKLVSISSKNLDGNLASHENISYKWGGTDHIDPVEYWRGRGQKYFSQAYDMNQFKDLVTVYYNKNNYDVISNQRVVNYVAKINQAGRNDGLFAGGPWRATASSRSAKERATSYNQQQVKVTKLADTKKATWAEITLNNGRKYWIDVKGVQEQKPQQKQQQYDVISNQRVVNYVAKINQTGRNDGLFAGGPWRTTASSMSAKERATSYNQQQVKVTKLADTKNATWAEITLNNGKVFWIDKKGIQQITTINLTGTSAVQQKWLNGLIPNAINTANNNHIWVSVLLAQMVTESAWGQSELALRANNLFGIKATSDWRGEIYKVKTQEVAGRDMVVTDFNNKAIHVKKGSAYYIYANFRKYKTQADSLNDYALKIRQNYGTSLRSNTQSYTIALQKLQNSGYATDPNYVINMVNRIQKYQLNVFD